MSNMARKLSLPMEVRYRPAWLTWVASTTTCLNALGVDCDAAEVAGVTGYAFVMAVHDELCSSGPTMFEWGTLEHGVHLLGRSTLVFASSDCHGGEHSNGRTREHCREAYELVEREIAAGRPCVLWGAYVPEFSAVVGVEDGHYLVRSFFEVLGEPKPPVPYDGLEAPGGPYVLAFPTSTARKVDPGPGDRFALGHAVRLLRGRSSFPQYGFGLGAYERWIRALDTGTLSDTGNAYNARCWAEAKSFGRLFLERVADRNPDLETPVRRAVEAYGALVPAMRRVSDLFPFPAEGQSEDAARRAEAIEALQEAHAAESRATVALEEAVLC